MSSGRDGWRGNIYRLALSPAYRRRGLAPTLVAGADRRLRRMGARLISAVSGHRHDERMRRYDKTL